MSTRRRVAAAIAHALALLLLAGAAGGCAAAPTPAPPPSVRLVTWNIRHARGLDDRVDVDRVAQELAALAPDVVCLQEVDVGVARSGRLDLPQELARRLSMHAAFGKNIDYQGGDYGNAILSRFPIETQRNHHYRMLRTGEQRGLLLARVRTPAGPLTVASTHLDYRPDPTERLANAEEIVAAVPTGEPCVVAGDFNDRPDSALHARLAAALSDCWREPAAGATFPADAPDRRIDWVLVGPAGPWPLAARVVPTAASDHRPVAVELATAR